MVAGGKWMVGWQERMWQIDLSLRNTILRVGCKGNVQFSEMQCPGKEKKKIRGMLCYFESQANIVPKQKERPGVKNATKKPRKTQDTN